MTNLEALLQRHSIEAVCAADRAQGKSHILINVGCNSRGRAVPSLERLKRKVEKCIVMNKKHVFATTKLYIIGDWINAEPDEVQDEKPKTLKQQKEAEMKRTLTIEQGWKHGVDTIRNLIATMGNLKELVWTSGLPFMTSVFNELPTDLTKLVLDLGNHVRVVNNGTTSTLLHIRADDMKPLMKQTRLLELRLLRLRDTLQFVAWKTVFLNEQPGGMKVLELQMDVAPIIRNNKWNKASDVHGLTVTHSGLLEKPYKGLDGKGGLHWSFGYGEYLDGDCIRRARIASGLEEAVPLPLKTLRLDGFVIDHLPFERELTEIMLLICDEKCFDAGMRAPKTQAEPYNDWSKKVNNVACRFRLEWPNWNGIFDTKGDQRNKHGDVVPQIASLSTPYTKHVPSSHVLPLTEKALSVTGLSDESDKAAKPNGFRSPPTLHTLSIPDTFLDAVSNVSECDSEVPAPTELSPTTTDEIFTVDGLFNSGSGSAAGSCILQINGASDSTPEFSPTSTSCNSNFGSDAPTRGHKVRKSLSDNYWVLGPS